MRMSAFEEMAELFGSDPSSCNEYYEEWPKLINDNNPGSQEKALLALKVFIEKSNQSQFSSRFDGRESIKVLIDKCIAPGKPQIKKVSLELIFDIFEKKDKSESFEAIQSQLQNKNQKVRSGA